MTSQVINIIQADVLDKYRVRIEFNDGSVQVVDFASFLQRSRHPDVRKFLDRERFAAFRIEFGNLVWGDFELCFPVSDLHANAIDRQAALEGQA